MIVAAASTEDRAVLCAFAPVSETRVAGALLLWGTKQPLHQEKDLLKTTAEIMIRCEFDELVVGLRGPGDVRSTAPLKSLPCHRSILDLATPFRRLGGYEKAKKGKSQRAFRPIRCVALSRKSFRIRSTPGYHTRNAQMDNTKGVASARAPAPPYSRERSLRRSGRCWQNRQNADWRILVRQEAGLRASGAMQSSRISSACHASVKEMAGKAAAAGTVAFTSAGSASCTRDPFASNHSSIRQGETDPKLS